MKNQPNELFVREEDTEADLAKLAKIARVGIRRNRAGQWSSLPQAYDSEDMGSLEQLYGLVGAGSYELRGLDASGRIVRKERITLEGREEDEEEPEAPAPLPVPPIPMPMPMVSHGGGGFEGLLVAMSQQTTNLLAAMMQAQSQQMSAMTNLLGVVLAPRNDGGQMVDLLAKVLDTKAQVGDPQQTFLAGAKMVMDIQEGKKEAETEAKSEGEGLGGMLQTATQAMQLVQAFKGGDSPLGQSLGVVEAVAKVGE